MRFNHFWEDDFKLQHTLSFGIGINPSTQSALLHMAACVLLSLLLLIPSVALAQLGGINIESARILDSSPESIYVEITASNSGKLDGVLIGANAQSSPDDPGPSSRSNLLPVGEKNPIRVIVSRPNPRKGLQTHFLNVFAYQGGKSTFLNQRLKLEHSWADLPDETPSPSSVQLEGINIESVKIIDSSPAFITVEVTTFNNSGLKHVFMGAHAQSSSPEDTSSEESYRLAYLPVGQKRQIPVTVQRPTQRKGLQTHFLNIIVQQDGKSEFLSRTFELEHSWADLPDNVANLETIPPSLAELGGISIESAKITRSSQGSIDVEVTASNNGKLGRVLIGAHAQSSSPEDAEIKLIPPILQVMEKNQISLRVDRPSPRSGLKTDVIDIVVYKDRGPVFLRRSFKLEHSWDEQPGNKLGSINIESIRVIKSEPTAVTVEVITSYNGELGNDVFIAASAIDPSPPKGTQSSTMARTRLRSGEKNRVSLKVDMPRQGEEPKADVIRIFVHKPGFPEHLSRSYKLDHSGAELSESTVTTFTARTAESARREAEDPYPSRALSEAMKHGGFKEVDALVEKWNASQERDPYGTLKFNAILGHFSGSGCLATTSEWQKQNPQSILPSIIEAHCRSDRYRIRDGMDPFSKELALKELSLAKEALSRTKANAADSPLWYATNLIVAIALQEDEKTISAIFEEAVKKFPQYDSLYIRMASRLFTYRGQMKEMQKLNRLTDRFVKATAVKEGNAGYAHMYLSIDRWYSGDLFQDSVFSWGKIKSGFEDLTSRYPDPSMVNLNRYALAACKAYDKETYRSLKKRIGDKISPYVWGGIYTVEVCDRRFSEIEMKI